MRINDILDRHDIQSISERLYQNVDWSGGPLACWPYLGRTKKGYGIIDAAGVKQVPTHRLSYALANGPLPELIHGKPACVLHHCDNPPCCNPAHLFLGTQRDNIDDMLAKGRTPKGEDSARSVLTETEVREILSSREPSSVIAQRFGIGVTTVATIRQRKTWRHLTDIVVPDRYLRRSHTPNMKLTEDDVRTIRADATRTHKALGLAYGVSRKYIGHVKEGRAWKHLT